jgi:hypothetical protein
MNDPFSHSIADEASSESPAARLARYAAEPVTAEDIEQLLRLAKLGQELAGRRRRSRGRRTHRIRPKGRSGAGISTG